MRISLSSKVFIAVQALCTFAVLGMGFAAYLSFNHGFLGYLNDQSVERLERIVPRLERAYVERGSWQFLAGGDLDAWFELARPDEMLDGDPFSPSSPPISDLTGAFLRITLLDAQQRYVIGYRQYGDKPILRAVKHGQEVVGWLAMTPFESVSAAGDRRFQLNQSRSSWIIGLVCLLVSAVIGWWISRTLLRPVRRVAEATHKLAAGDYSIQVPVTSNDEAGQLAADFNRMAGALASNERQRRDFMADISHELRTPLAVLRGELEAMEDGIRPVDPPALRSLQAEVAQLSKLVDDLFDLSLAEVGGPTYRREAVELRTLLDTTVAAFEPRFAERGLRLCQHCSLGGMQVMGDEQRLGQVLYNLLENSLRYTDPGGETRVLLRHERGQVMVDVMDSSPDVPAGQHERLFERFYRVEGSRNRASGGAGLGLAICRGIAEVHGGHLRAQPSPLGGLWLTLTLPEAHP